MSPMNHLTYEIKPICPVLNAIPIAHGAVVVPGLFVRMLSKAALLLVYVPKYSPEFKSSLGSAILKSVFEKVVDTGGNEHLLMEWVDDSKSKGHFLSHTVI